tara:strand:+ start:10520 stop:11644 length:1125 start_codon:yes stop_codon:yes gene_type:complete
MRKNLNIFIFQPYPNFGGADRSIIRIINSIDNAEFTIVSIKKCDYGKYINKKITYLKLDSKRSILSIFELRKKISNLIRFSKYKKNIFISNQHFANIVSILSLKKITNLKLILIDRNHLDELKNYNSILKFFKNNLLLLLIKYTYQKADAVVGISKELCNDLSSYIGKKVFLIYNPALDEHIYKKIKQKIKISTKLQEKKILLNVGFFENQKDQITILKAIRLLKKEIDNFHLILIGRGSKYYELQNFIKTNKLKNFVSFFKNVNNPEYFYKISNLFILSSKYEGFGNVVVEAMKNKCPIITSNCKSGPMEIIANGKYGDYFNIGDYFSLKEKIKMHLLNEKRLKKKVKLSKQHIQKFSLKNNKLKFMKLFNEI